MRRLRTERGGACGPGRARGGAAPGVRLGLDPAGRLARQAAGGLRLWRGLHGVQFRRHAPQQAWRPAVCACHRSPRLRTGRDRAYRRQSSLGRQECATRGHRDDRNAGTRAAAGTGRDCWPAASAAPVAQSSPFGPCRCDGRRIRCAASLCRTAGDRLQPVHSRRGAQAGHPRHLFPRPRWLAAACHRPPAGDAHRRGVFIALSGSLSPLRERAGDRGLSRTIRPDR